MRDGRLGPQIADLEHERHTLGHYPRPVAAAEGSDGEDANTTSGRGARNPATADQVAKLGWIEQLRDADPGHSRGWSR